MSVAVFPPRLGPPPWSTFLPLLLVVAAPVWGMGERRDAPLHFPAPTDSPLQKMVMDSSTNRLYVGAQNRLYDLTADLTVRVAVTTGPLPDNPDCNGPPEESNCHPVRQLTDSHTKALAINDQTSKLVECSSLYQGRCRIRNLHNISDVLVSSSRVVANDANSSSVAIVGSFENRKVLYVASTATSLGSFRDNVPAVAALLLEKDGDDKEFDLAFKGVRSNSAVQFERTARETYPVEYVGGFEVGQFLYFSTIQPTPGGGIMHSKLIRICTKDAAFNSYTEVPLVCEDDSGSFNLLRDVRVGTLGYAAAIRHSVVAESEPVVVGVFEEGDTSSPHHTAPTSRSALCLFPIKDIEEAFKKNIMQCYKDDHADNLIPWLSNNGRCRKTQLDWSMVECGNDVNTRVGGRMPISARPELVVGDARVTSVVINTTGASTVVFMGTRKGEVIKAVLERSGTSIYDRQNVTNGIPILQDLEFDATGRFFYALTSKAVWKYPSSTCDAGVSSCRECMAKKDPHCGWCVLTSQCTRSDDCTRKVPFSSTDWLPYDTNQCPSIRWVFPAEVQMTRTEHLNVSLEHIKGSSPSSTFNCVFYLPDRDGSISLRTKATRVEGEGASSFLRCSTPSRNEMQSFISNRSLWWMEGKLGVVESSTREESVLATTKLTFFDCGKLSSCTECTRSPFPCDWCLLSNKCSSGLETEDSCRDEMFINGISRVGDSSRRGPSQCPHIAAASSTITAPAYQHKLIKVKAQNLDLSYMDSFHCLFRFPSGKVVESLATKRESSLECTAVEFTERGRVGVEVQWSSKDKGRRHSLDNAQGIEVEVYQCDEIADDCGTCLTLDTSKYACGWCSAKPSCVSKSSCHASFLNSSQLCPGPRIDSFEPHKGPIDGNTTVTIRGRNLGRSATDIKTVQVNNVECRVVWPLFVPPSTIVCTTGPGVVQRDGEAGEGIVVVQLTPGGREFSAMSSEKFAYVTPRIDLVAPSEGPKDGGTHLNLTGTHLDAGSNINIFIGSHRCQVLSRSESWLVCATPPSEDTEINAIEVKVDGHKVKMKSGLGFRYKESPRWERVEPLRSLQSGGIRVTVEGHAFRLLQRPRIIFFGDGNDNSTGGICTVRTDSQMECSTPPMPRSLLPSSSNEVVRFAFDFDGTTTRADVMTVYLDPDIPAWTEERFFRPTEKYLTINGERLSDAASERDIKIMVGGSECSNVMVAPRVLTCRPPSSRPPTNGGRHPEVTVTIADRRYRAGVLSYDTPGMSSSVMGVVAVAALFLVALLLLLLVLYRKKTSSHARQMKQLKNKMDAIESRVATECKEAFAELQTTLNAYTADLPLGSSMVPFLEYREYAGRVLFPNTGHKHTALRQLEVEAHKAKYVEDGLKELQKLLHNKTFLLTLVRTMESNKYFLAKDRVYFGSLLMVVLQEKMAYCTDILKQLLRELIERTVEKKFQPKILFRRSESVAERMLAVWFSFLMHNYLTDCAGKKLFDLYWAMKQQMEKGPQDALTLDARYSLSEEKLLRATLNVREMIVHLSLEGGPEMGVRVLDCDSITQVKEKCLEVRYRSLRYSDRPRAEDVDLEYRHSQHGRILLLDLDGSTRTEAGGWKRLNTLSHYAVPPNAVLILTPRQSSLYNLSLLSDKSSFSIKNSPTLSRPNLLGGTNSSQHSKESESKLYHLVKPTEHGPTDNQEKMVTEIYLTRLLMMKGTLNKFINDLLEVIFSSSKQATLPACVKYMFDFMDGQALEHGITDPEVTHAWKSNALPLRFWVNLIKNPNFIFDIPKPTKIEGCLSVVAQTLMDACSTQDHLLTKDSPSSKLLFAKDMPEYRDWVDSYYSEVAHLPAISEAEMTSMLNEESRARKGQLQVFSALHELYKYVEQHKEALVDSLEGCEQASGSQLPGRLQDLLALMESQRAPSDYDSNTLGLGYNSASRLMPRDRV